MISKVNVRDSSYNDRSALMCQAIFGTVEGIEFLLARKPPALINLQDSHGNTALHLAVYISKDPAKLRFLLDNGADKTIRDNHLGRTALEYARKHNCPKECIKMLESYTPKLRG